MSNTVWLAKQKWARKVATQGTRASARAPLSTRAAASDNSHGSLEASAELISYLNIALDDLDPHESLSLNVQHTLRRLISRAQKYSNFGLAEGIGRVWVPSQENLQYLRIAIACSIDVYGTSESTPLVDGCHLQLIREGHTAVDGVRKAVRFFSGKPLPEDREAVENLLIVAVRGTVTKSLDWATNLNSRTREADEFFTILDSPVEGQRLKADIEVHRGFLNAVKALVPLIEEHVRSCLQTPIRHVLFTGHSAGGAVASLAYMYILARATAHYPEFKFSLITFGCPPVVSRTAVTYLENLRSNQEHAGIALAVINEHDPIPRADTDYVKSITTLYNEYGGVGLRTPGTIDQPWVLPAPNYYLLGDLLVLKDDESAEQDGLKFYSLEMEQFSQLLFCDSLMHRKQEYLDKINTLARVAR